MNDAPNIDMKRNDEFFTHSKHSSKNLMKQNRLYETKLLFPI